MRATFRLVFFVFILVPCLIFGYQNCSDLSSKDSNVAANPGSIHQTSIGDPMLLEDLAALNYSGGRDCTLNAIDPLKLYDPNTHLCTVARNSCEASFLIGKGFSEDNIQICDGAFVATDGSGQTFKAVNVNDLGYKSDPNTMCTMQFMRMVNIRSKNCADASNGCAIGFLSSQGYIADITSLCN